MKSPLLAPATIIAVASLSHAIAQPNASEVTPNIVGGIETPEQSRPYQVALLMNGRQGCGGTLLSPNWVLTAAHCLDNASTNSLTVRVGAHSIRQGDGQTIRVSQIIKHEQWRGANAIRSGYDIAVLRLASPASSQYTPARLPSQEIAQQHAGVGSYVTVSGWGLTSNQGRPSDVLREVDLPVISNQNCSSQLNYSIPNSVICGGGQGGRSACNGDSGGPYAVRVGDDFYSIGTVSWGIQCRGATAFTRTTSYLDWIADKTGLTPGDPQDGNPIADFNYSISGSTVNFSNASTDDDGIISYQWQFGDGSSSTQANPSHNYNQTGSFNVTLTVTDTSNQTDSVSKVVTVGETPPGCDGVMPWDASTSYALGDKVSYNGFEYEAVWWSQGAKPDLFPNVWRKGSACTGGSDPAPTAAFSTNVSGLSVTLINNSSDNGQITSYLWQFGDGQTSQDAAPTHNYVTAGNYTITLTVTDDQGQGDTATKTIQVGDAGNCNGVAAWSANRVYNSGDQVRQNATIYQARWWTQGESPQSSGQWGVWARVGNCN